MESEHNMPIKTARELQDEANARANKINYLAQKRILMTEVACKKAVHTAFDAWLAKAALSERQAFLETLGTYAKGTAAERIAYFASTMAEAPEATPAPVEAPVVPAKPGKVDRATQPEAGAAQA